MAVDQIKADAQIPDLHGNAQIPDLHGNAQIPDLHGNAQIPDTSQAVSMTFIVSTPGASQASVTGLLGAAGTSTLDGLPVAAAFQGSLPLAHGAVPVTVPLGGSVLSIHLPDAAHVAIAGAGSLG